MDELQETTLPGEIILHTPLLNKGTGFTMEEREELGLHGLLPPRYSTIEEQVARRYKNFSEKQSDVEKYQFLNYMQNRNEVLFYRFAAEYSDEVLPYIYTPTVGTVSVEYSTLYSQNRGLYLSYKQKDKLGEIFSTLSKNIDVIVVTDGSRILGLGDLGLGGMAISVGKLSLYSLFGGVHPARTLPVILDLGTDNQELLDDPFYLGWRHERVKGEEYDSFIHEFVAQLKKHVPDVLLQWEDFSKLNAARLLDKYKNEICSFNDDIQGTASVTLGAILSAIRANKVDLRDQKFVIYGAGSAGIGTANLIMHELMRQGVSEEKARDAFYLFNSKGLIHTGAEIRDDLQKDYARVEAEIDSWDVAEKKRITLLETVKHVKPSILIGVSGQAGAFTEDVVREMAKHTSRPIIFPLSNPTANTEALPKDLYEWTDGRVIVGTGSPFKPVEYAGQQFSIAQCNNVYIFPGVGLGVLASKSKCVTNEMFVRAAEILAAHSPMAEDPCASLFPSIKKLRDVSREIGIAVAQMAVEQGLATADIEGSVEEAIDNKMWFPKYTTLRRPKDS